MALKNVFGAIGLEETQQTIQYYLNMISNKLSVFTIDTTGRLRGTQVIESGTVTTVSTVTTVTTVTTVSTVSAVTNLAQMGGYATSYDQYCQIQGPADSIRSKIAVS